MAWTTVTMRAILCVCIILLAGQASATVINIIATADGNVGDSNGDSHYNTLDTTGAAVGPDNAGLGRGKILHQRGIWEFSLAGIAANATINSVTFQAQPDVTSGTGSLVMDFTGYAGNGKIDLADAIASDTVVGSLAATLGFPNNSQPVNVSIDTTFFRSLLGNSSFVGLAARIDVVKYPNAVLFAFNSLENPNKQYIAPTLRVDFTVPQAVPVPEPGTLILAAAMLPALGLLIYKRRHSR